MCLLSAGDSTFAQQSATPPAAPPPSRPPAQATPTQTALRLPRRPTLFSTGTPVKLRLAENLTSASAKAGQQVSFEVTEEVDVQGIPVIPKGAQALATVTDRLTQEEHGPAAANSTSTSIPSASSTGEKAQLRAVRDAKGGGHIGAMTGAMVATAVVFFPAAAPSLPLHPRQRTSSSPKGTEVTAFVQGDMRLDLAKMVPPPSFTDPAAPARLSLHGRCLHGQPLGSIPPPPAPTSKSTAPSSATLPPPSRHPGQHTIAVRKKGYTDWTRTMNVSGTSVHPQRRPGGEVTPIPPQICTSTLTPASS